MVALSVPSDEKCSTPEVSCWNSTPSRSHTVGPSGPDVLIVPFQLRRMFLEKLLAVG